jgi:hypothetical protein
MFAGLEIGPAIALGEDELAILGNGKRGTGYAVSPPRLL